MAVKGGQYWVQNGRDMLGRMLHRPHVVENGQFWSKTLFHSQTLLVMWFCTKSLVPIATSRCGLPSDVTLTFVPANASTAEE